MVEAAGVGKQLNGVDEILRAEIHIVENAGFLGVLSLDELIGCRTGKITVVVKNLVNHLRAYLGAHVGNQHGLGHEFLVEPVAETLGGIRPVVVDPEPEGEGIAYIRGDEGIVGLDVYGVLHIGGYAGRGLFLPLRDDVDFLHAGIEDVVSSEALCSGARGGKHGHSHDRTEAKSG